VEAPRLNPRHSLNLEGPLGQPEQKFEHRGGTKSTETIAEAPRWGCIATGRIRLRR
jgi:hypothetical protein